MSHSFRDGKLGGAHKRRAKQGKEMWKPGSWLCCPCRYGKQKCSRKARRKIPRIISEQLSEARDD